MLAATRSEVADAAMRGNRSAVRALLRRKPTSMRRKSMAPRLSHWAVRANDLEMAELLLRAGANVSAANQSGATPMLLAAINGNAAMLERLIKAGADPNAPALPNRRHGAHDGGAHREDWTR